MGLAQTVTCQTRLRVGKIESRVSVCVYSGQSKEIYINRRSMVVSGSPTVVDIISGRYICISVSNDMTWI